MAVIDKRITKAFAKSPKKNRARLRGAAQKLADAFTSNPTGLIDGRGHAVPLSRKDAFEKRKELMALAKELHSIRDAIAHAMPDGLPDALRALIQLQVAIVELEENMPFAPCPRCTGGKTHLCKACYARGWVTRLQWKALKHGGRTQDTRSVDRLQDERGRSGTGGGETDRVVRGTSWIGEPTVRGVEQCATEQPGAPELHEGHLLACYPRSERAEAGGPDCGDVAGRTGRSDERDCA